MSAAQKPSDERLRQMLVSGGIVSQENVDEAFRRLQGTTRRLADVLLEMGVVNEDEAQSVTAMQYGAPYIDLTDYILDPEEVRLVPREFASVHQVIVVSRKGSQLSVAMADPLNLPIRDRLRLATGCSIRALLADRDQILETIQKYYSMESKIEDIAQHLVETTVISSSLSSDAIFENDVNSKVPIIELANMIVLKALKMHASDIHLEPAKSCLRLRFRIDGVLHDISSLSKLVQPAITSRIKVLSHMNISEKRLPQDGRFNVKVRDTEADVRVSSLPMLFGEKIVMRLLSRDMQATELNALGISPPAKAAIEKVIPKPFGMILVTGPTGSGKTTTIYSILSRLCTTQTNIITIEDPVEFQLDRVNQIPINVQAGMTFATALRSVLRQDPNIIMVGEIRDVETAELAVRAALTGHLVLSTLHTNDAAGTVTRLVDMGIEPFLLSSSLLAVIAQRLVRVICPTCRAEAEPSQHTFDVLGVPPEKRPAKVYVGRGCPGCHDSGFSGRQGLYEVLLTDDALRRAILQKEDSSRIRDLAVQNGMVTMLEDGLLKVREGVTTPEEVLRAVY